MSGAFVGIDPGLDGGIAAIDLDHSGGGAVWQTWRMPTARDGSKRVIDREAFEDILIYEIGPTAMIALEKVNAGAVKSITSAFAFGRGYGLLEGVIGALQRPLAYVPPRDWCRELGIPVGAKKPEHIATARRLFPTVPIVTDGQADALLIAEWCRRTWGPR